MNDLGTFNKTACNETVRQSTLEMSFEINDGKWGFNFAIFDMGISSDSRECV